MNSLFLRYAIILFVGLLSLCLPAPAYGGQATPSTSFTHTNISPTASAPSNEEPNDAPLMLWIWGIFTFAATTLVILKVFSVIAWSWAAVLSPFWVIGVLALLALGALLLFTNKYTRVKKKPAPKS